MNLQSHADDYIRLRRALGFKAHIEESALNSFVGFIESRGQATGPIPARIALDWACSASFRSGRAGQISRFTCARHFLAYLKAFLPETEVPTPMLRAEPRPRPYIYSEAEISRMQQATRQLWTTGSLRQITFETLIGLLASTGLRIGEALRLTMHDVQMDLNPPRLEICNTKFGKSRLVPIHPTTVHQLRRYAEQRRKLARSRSSDAFLLFTPGKPTRYETVLHWFHQIARVTGIPKKEGQRGPALHCFRHTFAVRRLQAWYRAGLDVHALLPHLAVYLGHLSPIQTYHYLTATPELLASAAEIFENHTATGGGQ